MGRLASGVFIAQKRDLATEAYRVVVDLAFWGTVLCALYTIDHMEFAWLVPIGMLAMRAADIYGRARSPRK